jgi:hypothetical protein
MYESWQTDPSKIKEAVTHVPAITKMSEYLRETFAKTKNSIV